MTRKISISLLAIISFTFICINSIQAQEVSYTPIDYSEYILTPKAPASPQINSAKVFGVRPGSPFQYMIATSGDRPMTFEVDGLPKGLKLDKATGIITGKIKKAGEYKVILRAKNAKGSDERELRIKVGDQIALTPPMGWSSWNCFTNSVSQEKVQAVAQAMIDKGLVNYGWTYVNIDDGWQGKRGGKHNGIQPNHKFPDMKGLADFLHKNGMKLGIYSGPWCGTYAGYIGSHCDNEDGTYDWIEKGERSEDYQYIVDKDPTGLVCREVNRYHGKYSFAKNDVKQFVDWGVDYLKYDWAPNDYYYAKEMSEALKKSGRDIVYSISNSAPYGDACAWLDFVNCWRTTGDIRDNWRSVYKIGFQGQDRWVAFNRPGHWADADMLVVGMVGWRERIHNTKLTPDEQYTHISLWSILASPMLIGADIAQMDDFTLSLLCNREVNDVNQDPAGIQAYPYYRGDDYVTYIKHLEDGSMAVAMFNLSDKVKKIGIKPSSLGFRGTQKIRDLWRQKDVAEIDSKERFDTEVNPHGVSFIRIYPGNSKERVIGEPKTNIDWSRVKWPGKNNND